MNVKEMLVSRATQLAEFAKSDVVARSQKRYDVLTQTLRLSIENAVQFEQLQSVLRQQESEISNFKEVLALLEQNKVPEHKWLIFKNPAYAVNLNQAKVDILRTMQTVNVRDTLSKLSGDVRAAAALYPELAQIQFTAKTVQLPELQLLDRAATQLSRQLKLIDMSINDATLAKLQADTAYLLRQVENLVELLKTRSQRGAQVSHAKSSSSQVRGAKLRQTEQGYVAEGVYVDDDAPILAALLFSSAQGPEHVAQPTLVEEERVVSYAEPETVYASPTRGYSMDTARPSEPTRDIESYVSPSYHESSSRHTPSYESSTPSYSHSSSHSSSHHSSSDSYGSGGGGYSGGSTSSSSDSSGGGGGGGGGGDGGGGGGGD